jgi:hypothetical protein
MPPADAHEFAAENVASQRKFGAGNALISVSLWECFNQRFLRKMLAAAFYRIDSILHAERNVP